MTSMWLTVRRGTFEEFMELYTPCMATQSPNEYGETLLIRAVGNTNVGERLAIANRLLDDGADPAFVSGTGYNVLHILFGARSHDFEAEVPLLRRLLNGGADLNLVSRNKGASTPPLGLIGRFNRTEAEMAPFYDEIFSRDDLDLLTPNLQGRSLFEIVEGWDGTRPDFYQRMREYLSERGFLPEGAHE